MTPIKIGFVLLSNSSHPSPSTRVAVLNMFPFLRAANFEPHIVFEPAEPTETPDVSGLATRLQEEGFRIVFFQKVYGPSVEQLAQQLSAAGIRTVYGMCDVVDIAMTTITDATTLATEYLKSLYPQALHAKIHIVHDGIEHPEARKTQWTQHRGSRSKPLRAVLVTSAHLDRLPVIDATPDWLEIAIVGNYPPAEQRLKRLREMRWTLADQPDWRARLAYLRFLANPRIRCMAWDPAGVYEAMRQADIGIIPIEGKPGQQPGASAYGWKVKASENRLTLKMCMGLPVIATPLPSYEQVIEQGQNGFLARSPQDWAASLEALRDPELRRSIGERARAAVLPRYSMAAQADRLINVLNNLNLQEYPPCAATAPHVATTSSLGTKNEIAQ